MGGEKTFNFFQQQEKNARPAVVCCVLTNSIQLLICLPMAGARWFCILYLLNPVRFFRFGLRVRYFKKYQFCTCALSRSSNLLQQPASDDDVIDSARRSASSTSNSSSFTQQDLQRKEQRARQLEVRGRMKEG